MAQARFGRRWQALRAAGIAALLAIAILVAPAAANEPIKIGVSAPLSGSAAFLGQHQQWGAILAGEVINARGGALGRPVEIVVEDNKCNPAEAVSTVEKLISRDGVVAITGAMCSSATLAAMPVVQRHNVPLVVAISTHVDITAQAGVGGNQWTFRLNPSDDGLAQALARYLADEEKIQTISFIAEDTDYGRGGVKALSEALEEYGVRTLSADYYKQGEADFTAVLTRISRQRPDVVAVYALAADQLNLLRQYQELGLQVPLSGRLELTGLHENIIRSGVLDGSTSVFPYSAHYDSEANREFVALVRERFGEDPIYQTFGAYEAVMVIADAIERAGSADPAAVRDALVTTSYRSMLDETLTFDDHHQAHNNAVIMKVENGRVVIVGVSRT